MKQMGTLSATRLFTVCLLLFFIFFIHQGCTKIDTADTERSSVQVTAKFFALPPGTDPIVLRIADKLKTQNKEKEFITAFAKNEGYALWGKAQLRASHHTTASFQNNSVVADGDSVVIIPLVLENTELVNGYLQVTISDSISILEYRRSGYTYYPFSSGVNDDRYTAEKYQVQMMSLDKFVFGDTVFKILDNRLFAEANPVSQRSRYMRLSPSPAQQGGGANLFEEEAECWILYEYECDAQTMTFCTLIDITITCIENGGGGGGGTGPGPGGGTPPGGGGGTPGGGGGGTAPYHTPVTVIVVIP